MVRIGRRTRSRSYEALGTELHGDDGSHESDDTQKMKTTRHNSHVGSDDSFGDDVLEPRQNPIKKAISQKIRQTSSMMGKRNRKMPSYMLSARQRIAKGSKSKIHHGRLPTSEEEALGVEYVESDEDEEVVHPNGHQAITKRKQAGRRGYQGINRSGKEHSTDAEYGITSYSYTSSNPTSSEYEPRALRKMKTRIDRSDPERRRRCIFSWIVVAVIFSLLVIIVAIVSTSRSNDIMKVKMPPANIEEICSVSNVATEKGYNECEKECKGGACCMSSGSRSCFLEQEDICGLYSACGTIHSGVEIDNTDEVYVPPAPDNLGSICSKGSIAEVSGFIECQSLCHAGLCCQNSSLDASKTGSNDVAPCDKSHADVCDSYLPCENLQLKEDGIDHGDPVTLVNEKCTPMKVKQDKGRQDCENLCQQRSCCFTESLSKNCLADNKVWCSEFEACDILIGSDNDVTTHKDVQEPDEYASMDELCKEVRSISDRDFPMCNKACEPARCCFFEDVDCHHLDCSSYSYCEIIVTMLGFGNGSIHTKPKDEESDKGQDDTGTDDIDLQSSFFDDIILNPILPEQVEIDCADISTSSRRDDCHFACSDFMCCFETDYDERACHKKSVCDQYTRCKVLNYESESGKNDEDHNIGDACSVENMMRDGGEECQQMCRDHMCCVSTENSCSEKPQCEDYKACGLLVENNIVGDSAHDSIKALVDKACTQDKLKTEQGFEDCAALCKPAECCFTGECMLTECDDYGGCEDVYLKPSSFSSSDAGLPMPPYDMDIICNEENVKSSAESTREKCEEICQKAECCLNGTCKEEESICKGYSACQSVWTLQEVDDNSPPKSPVDKDMHEPWDACKKTNMSIDDYERCEESCAKWSCCWSSKTKENCSKIKPDECHMATTYCPK